MVLCYIIYVVLSSLEKLFSRMLSLVTPFYAGRNIAHWGGGGVGLQ
jgi:hypothetical protein